MTARRAMAGMALGGALALVAGCSSIPFGAGFTEEGSTYGQTLPPAVDGLEAGTHTDSDVLDLLGPPAHVTALPAGYAFLYEGGHLQSRSVGASYHSFRAAYAWSTVEFSIAAFVFDDDGRLTAGAIERRDDGSGRGFSIGTQGARAADQLVYVLPSSQHLWARSMLRRTPVLLNEQSSLDSGEHGFARRGTTAKVGQETLPSSYVTAIGLLDLLRTQTGQ